jgi:isopenicillin-N N-acyltransferase-like protein
MIARHYSPPAPPRERGREFGAAHAQAIAATAQKYQRLFETVAASRPDCAQLGREALAAISRHAPACASEIEGIAAGAGLPAQTIAMLNARTEILARLRLSLPAPGPPPPGRSGECSTVVLVADPAAAPVSVQTWDWHEEFADSWLVWTIEHPDGHLVHTLTEFGILGKIGVSSAGLGLHFNLLHHARDGGQAAMPVHVLARTVLDTSRNIGQALATIGAAPVSASSALTVVGFEAGEPAALTAEVFPGGPRFVGPGAAGLLLRTNHFLTPEAALDDQENQFGPDSFLRFDVLQRRLARRAGDDPGSVLAAMHSHGGGAGSVCCHPDPAAEFGERYATLATVSLDVSRGAMTVRAGGPCAADRPWQPVPAGPGSLRAVQ